MIVLIVSLFLSTIAQASFVTVVDTGHSPDLPANFSKFMSYDTYSCDDDATENHPSWRGHGTHVMGIASSECPDCTVGMVKIFGASNCGNNAGDGLLWAIASGADVISYSAGYQKDVNCETEDDDTLQTICQAIEIAKTRGVVFVAASGNNDGDITPVDFPASHDDVIAIGGVDYNGNRFNFCEEWGVECAGNTGPELEYVAPAFEVISSTFPGYDWNTTLLYGCGDSTYPALDGMGFCTGTSMSSPYAAAIFGETLNFNPLISLENLKLSVREFDDSDDNFGYGMIKVGEFDNVGYKYDASMTPLFEARKGAATFYSTSPRQMMSMIDLHGFTPSGVRTYFSYPRYEFGQSLSDERFGDPMMSIEATFNYKIYTKQALKAYAGRHYTPYEKLIQVRKGEDSAIILDHELADFEDKGFSFHGVMGYILNSSDNRKYTRSLYRNYDINSGQYYLSGHDIQKDKLLGYIPDEIRVIISESKKFRSKIRPRRSDYKAKNTP